jgi:hypothetical protein
MLTRSKAALSRFALALTLGAATAVAHPLTASAQDEEADRVVDAEAAPPREGTLSLERAADHDRHGPSLEGERLALEIDSELAAIDARSREATALYIAGTITHVAGLVAGGFFVYAAGASAGAGGLCGLGSGPCDTSTTDVFVGLAAASLGLSVAGLVTLLVGVGFDVDSGRRRRAWRERHGTTEARFGVAPLRGGGAVSLGLDF